MNSEDISLELIALNQRKRLTPKISSALRIGVKMRNRAAQPVDVQVGHNIRIRRLQKGLSQSELGRGVGVTFQQIQKYEKGANRVGASRLSQIADVLDV